MPRLLGAARTLYRLANENTKPDAERKSRLPGTRHAAQQVGRRRAGDRNYDEKVDKALVRTAWPSTLAQPAAQRNASVRRRHRHQGRHGQAQMQATLDKMYAGSKLGDKPRARMARHEAGRLQGQQRQLRQGRRGDVRAGLKRKPKTKNSPARSSKPTPTT
jgi:hypothetical protein